MGELIGFGGIPVLGFGAILLLSRAAGTDPNPGLMYAVAVAGGFGEGAVLAVFQLRVLRDCLPRLNGRRWVVATACAASLAWACGMLAPTLDEYAPLSATVQVAIWVSASIVILLSIGVAQVCVLYGVVTNPGIWAVGNVAGWLAGLPWTFVLPAMLPESAPVVVWVVTFVIAGVLMGATAGAVTAAFLLRLKPAQ